MRAPWLVLVLMLSAAVAVCLGGVRLSRREVVERKAADRERLQEFSEAFGGELSRLESLYESHLEAIVRALHGGESGSDASVVRELCSSVVGVYGARKYESSRRLALAVFSHEERGSGQVPEVVFENDKSAPREALSTVLGVEGFEVIAAADGQEALEKIALHRPGLVCLDIMMPLVDGYEVCRRIRRHDAATPILFLSAKSQEVDVVVGLELGGDDFIRKPFTRGEVLARIRAALRRSGKNGGERRVLVFGDLRVWVEELRAERRGRSVELTPREASMLEVLHEHAGCPVSRDVFLDRCWGIDYFPDSRTLNQHMVALRRKIELEDAPAIIETVRGVGYRVKTADAE